MKITRIFVVSALVFCGATAYADTSATSGYFTVDTAKFAIDDVTSPYCNGAYNSGRKATFISGVKCQIDFEVKIDTPATRQLSHFIVNGSKVASTVGFRMNVGGLNPGDKLEVIAVDKDGGKTEPFRVNIDVASGQPWTNGGNHFLAAKNETRGSVVYYLESFSVFSWCTDGISQMYEIADEEFPLNVTPSFKIASTFDSESAQYTQGVDIGASWSGVEDKVPALKRLVDGVKKQPMCKFAGAQVSGNFSGGYVCQWNPRSLRWESAGGTLGITVEGKLDLISFRVPQSLYLVYVRAGLDAQGSISASKINGEWSGEIGFDPLLGGHGTVGAGLQDALCVEGSATCGLFLKGQFPANPGYVKELGFDVKASWKTVFFGLEQPHGMWEKTFMWYPRDRMANISTENIRMLAAASPEPPQTGKPRLVRRDYLKKHATGKLLAAMGEATLGDGYPYPAPSLATGDCDVLVNLRDNTDRAAINRTELVCRTGVQGDFGAANAIWDDGTADFMPQIAQNGDGLAVAVWANAKAVYGDSDFELLYSGMETAVAVRNPATGEWTARNLTDDSFLDMTPKVAVAKNGSAVVGWVKNQSNDAIGTADLPSSLYVSYYREGVWTDPQQIATAAQIYSFDLAYDGMEAIVVYSKDRDGDVQTGEDAEIWYATPKDGNTVDSGRISAENANALRPFVWYSGEILRTVYVQDGTLMCSDNLGAAKAMESGAAIPVDCSLLKNADGSALVVWRSRKKGVAGDETHSLFLDRSGDLSGVPAVFIDGGDTFARNVTGGIAEDGSLRVAYECVSVSFDSEGAIKYGDVELRSIYRDAAVDICIADGALAFDGSVEAGGTVNVVATVANLGTVAAKGVEVELWRGTDDAQNRRLVGTTVVDIDALSSAKLNFPWKVEQGLDEIVFVAKADPSQETNDEDRSNNSLTWHPELMEGRLALRSASCADSGDTARRISAKVYNGGILPHPAGATVRFWRGEIGASLLGTSQVGEVVSGESGVQEVFCDWDLASTPMTSTVERVVIELSAGDSISSVAVDVRGMVWNLFFESQGGQVTETMREVMRGSPVGVLPVPVRQGSRFVGWYTMPDAGEEITAENFVNADCTLYAHWEKYICRIIQPSVSGRENEDAAITVAGGSEDSASSVKVYLTYNTAAAADMDLAKGTISDAQERVPPSGRSPSSATAKGLKFPLTLTWEKGEIGEKTITIPIKSDKAVEDDEFFTLQLAEPDGVELGADDTCKVTIHDPSYDELAAKIAAGTATKAETSAWDKLQKAKASYVLALADPADGGKVTGSGPCAEGKKVTLKATANKNFVFAGWVRDDGRAGHETPPDGYVATTTTLVIDRSARPAANSKTSTTITEIDGDVTYFAVFKSDPKVTVSVEATDDAGASPTGKGAGKYTAGSISGAGKYAPGKKVTLKAAANKGYVFAGWCDGGARRVTLPDGMISQAASWSFTMPSGDVEYVAKFVTVAEDAGYEIGLGIGDDWAGGAGRIADATLRCGVAVNWPISVDAISATTVKVAGLPAGLKLVQNKASGEYRVEGVPTTASKKDAKTGGTIRSEVKFTVTTAGKSVRTFTRSIEVKPLPPWAYGTFNGVASSGEEYPVPRGLVSMTVSATGKISGKAALDGTNYTFSASGYATDSYVVDDDSEASLVVASEAKAGKSVLPVRLYGVRENPVLSNGMQDVQAVNSTFTGTGMECGGWDFELCRDLWKDAGNAATLSPLAGSYTYLTADGGTLALVVDEKGSVKITGTLGDNRKVSLAGVLQPYYVDVYVPPSKAGPAYFERINIVGWHNEAVPGCGTAYRDAGMMIFSMSFDGAGSGAVTSNPKYGQAAAGKSVTLTAKPSKDSVFAMWIVQYAPGEQEMYYTPTLKLVSTGEDVAVAALFSSKQNGVSR